MTQISYTKKNNHLLRVKSFFTGFLLNTQAKIKQQSVEFYQNVLELDFNENNHKTQNNQQSKRQTQTQASSITTNKFKINPKLKYKLTKIQKSLSKYKQITQQTQNIKKNQESKQILSSKIKNLTLKKLQLKNKLRNLNSQLQKQKISYISFDYGYQNQNYSQINPQKSLLFNQLKNSLVSPKVNPSPPFSFSRIKSKSDAQFNLKKLSLQEKQAIYSPQKHQNAFKLIQKMHSEKLKKHEKILSEMKKKQQKQIETVKRLEIERKKQKEQKIKRQKILLTPKCYDKLSKSSVTYIDTKRINNKSQKSLINLSHQNIAEQNVQAKLFVTDKSQNKGNKRVLFFQNQKEIQSMQNEFLS